MKIKIFLKPVLISGLFLILVLPNLKILAEEFDEGVSNLEGICQWEKIEEKPENLSNEEYESLLRKCQAYYQQRSEKIENDIAKTGKEKKTLQNKIYTLEKKIKNLDYQIYQSNLAIKELSLQIEDTENSIQKTNLKIGDLKERLINILRTIYEEDQKSLIEILLSEDALSSFFDNLIGLEVLNRKNQEILESIKNLKSHLEEEKESLDKEKDSLEKIVVLQNLQKKESERMKREKEYFLRMTEAEYQKYLKEKEKTEEKIAKIGEKLWKLLIGVREVPTYEEAVKIAKFVEEQTGVRAAFLLGILTQESKIGRNIGQCFLLEPETGMGQIAIDGKKWPRVMKPDRDVPIFLEIIENLNRAKGLNLNPNRTPISCWIPVCATEYRGKIYFDYKVSVDEAGQIFCSKNEYLPYGWGGAMGAAQFIPSTWKKFQDEISAKTGETPDPWDFRHASLASALLLKKCGALSNEKKAAICYLGADYLGYANSVLFFASCHQDYIDTGSMSQRCQEAIGLE